MSAQVFRSLEAARNHFGPCALTIGNFDGVHLGHRSLVAATRAFAVEYGMSAAVLAFHPHPTSVVAPHRIPNLVCSLEERVRLLDEAGAEKILIFPFTPELALFSPEQFISQVVVDDLKARAVFVGENFRFGHQQAGTSEVLKQLGSQYDFEVKFIPFVSLRREIVSSSAIRQHLTEGRVSLAGRMLGRCFSLKGDVISGQGIGAKQTVPTLNLKPPSGQLVPRGVFVTETREPETGRHWQSITNAGVRPTFGGEELTVETFLLSPLEGRPPESIEVFFRRFVRAERQFPDAESLKLQIMKDIGRAKAYWRRASRLVHSAA